MRYKVYKYASMNLARKKVKSMKKMYGYAPKIFKVKNKCQRRILHYAVVKPFGLRRV